MWAVGPRTTTRLTRPLRSISWATFRPKVVLPAAGVAEARKLSPSWASSAASASRCQARKGRVPGQAGRVGAAIVVTGGGATYVSPRSEYWARDRARTTGPAGPRGRARAGRRVGRRARAPGDPARARHDGRGR